MADDQGGGGPPKRKARTQDMISESLKKVYEQDLEQEIPDHLKDFIARLEEADRDDQEDGSDT